MTTPAAPGGDMFSQGFTIAGHKIPYAAAGVVVAIVGVLLVMRARSSGSAVVAAGAATPAVTDPMLSGGQAYQPYASIGDLSTGLSDLRNAITSGQLTVSGAPGFTPVPVPGPAIQPTMLLSGLGGGVPLAGYAGSHIISGATTNIGALMADVEKYRLANPGQSVELLDPQGRNFLYLAPKGTT